MHGFIRIVSGAALLLAATTIADLRAQTRTAVRPADLVLRGGKIVTVDEARPVAEAMAIGGDTIVAVGPESEIQPYVGPATRVIDLQTTSGFNTDSLEDVRRSAELAVIIVIRKRHATRS